MEFKGTKGKWELDLKMFTQSSKFQIASWIGIRNDGRNLAEVKGFHCKIKNSECLKNAKLIAAAPELLEALQELVFVDSHPGDLGLAGIDAMAKAQSAINKALK